MAKVRSEIEQKIPKTNLILRTYGDNIVYTDWKKDNYIHAIKEVVGDMKENIGVEMDHMSLLTHK